MNIETTDKSNLLHSETKPQRNRTYVKARWVIVVIVVLCCITVTSLFLNLWQSGLLDSNNAGNQKNLINECNGNGMKYHDTNKCECFQCFSGKQCEEQLDDCQLMAGSGQPYLFLEFWEELASKTNRKNGIAPIEIPINYRVQYQYPTTVGVFSESSNNTFPERVSQLIRKVHSKYHNVDMNGKYLIYGVGATQLMTAAYVAWSRIRGEQIIAFNEIPYYMMYPVRCDAASPSYCVFNTSYNMLEHQRNDRIREIVTVPNNPDGWSREPMYKNQSSYALDLVYYWPHFYDNYDELKELDAPLSLWSFTKFTGHAATRFGWAFVDSYELASEMTSYISKSVWDISIESMRRAWDIFSFMESENGNDFFDFVRQRMVERWDVFLDILDRNDDFVLHSRIGTQYGWIEVVGKNESEIIEMFESYKIIPEYGSRFGSPGYVRFNLCEFEGNFVRIMQRFKDLVDNN